MDLDRRDLMRILRLAEVKEITGLGRSMIYALIAEQEFPRSMRLTPRGGAVGWLSEEIYDWINTKRAERDSQTIGEKS